MEIATQYASDVVLGHEPACVYVQQAGQRFLDDLKRTDKDEWEFWLNPDAAMRVCSFIEKFPHVKARSGLLVMDSWQVFCWVNLFGWMNEEGFRRFRTGYIEVTKKQGKSTMCAPVGLYGVSADGEEGAEVYTAAVTRDQAKIVWNMAKTMADRTPAFKEHFGVETGANAISHAGSASTFQALSREGKTLEGKNPSLVIVDELHRHTTREVWDILDESREARQQSLMLAITNSGDDKSSLCYEQRSYLLKILAGQIKDESYFGVVYTIDEDDHKNWQDERVWRKAQPGLGTATHLSGIRRLAAQAKNMPSKRASFLRYQLGIWAEGEMSWIPSHYWDACANENIQDGDLEGAECYVGFDLASKIDVAAMVAVFRLKDGKLFVKPRFYVPESKVEDNNSYTAWADEGHLVVTQGETIDFEVIEDDFAGTLKKGDDADGFERNDDGWLSQFKVIAAPYDQHQANQFATRMMAQGAEMTSFPQTAMKMSEPMKELHRMCIEHELEHDGNPMMSWMVSNVKVKPDRNENWFPRKDRSEDKIDGPVAMIMGGGMWVGKEFKKPSKYKRGAGLAEV